MSQARFAAQFERIVWPLLSEQAFVCGTLISCGMMDFAVGMDRLVTLACSRGAAYLRDFDDFEALLASTLLAEINAAEGIAARIIDITT